jgi:competence protein ComEA
MTGQGTKPGTEAISGRLVRLARAASGDPEAARAEAAMASAGTAPAGPGSTGDEPPAWVGGQAGRLVERWLPGGTRAAHRLRSATAKRRGLTALVVAVVAAIGMAIASSQGRPVAESAPSLPAAVSAMASASSRSAGGSAAPADGPIVVSVVGKVASPGLVRLPGGARVADALQAAGGALPAVDLSTLNLARRLSDGEQIYVGIPVPPGVTGNVVDSGGAANPGADSGAGSTADAGGSGPATTTPRKRGKKGHKSVGADAPTSGKVNLNTATVDELETLPGVGPATAQRILTWRTEHGQFSSVSDLREVGGIGDAKLATLQDLVMT